MASLLRKLRLGAPSVPVPGDGNDSISSFEYSFAMVYNGPPLSYSIPEVPPFKIDQIPVAAIAPCPGHEFSVPVIQPLAKAHHPKLKLARDSLVPSNSQAPAVESSNRIDNNPIPLGSDGDVHKSRSTSSQSAQKLPTCSATKLEVPGDDEIEHRRFHSGINPIPTNSDTTESGSSSRSCSSDICSCGEDERNDDVLSPRHRKCPSAVTFRDPESNDMVDEEELVDSQVASHPPVQARAVRAGKKGTCYRCLKGNRLTEKVVCIACRAKYCGNCVIRAMGCMLEGRKCVACIGYRIDESKRRTLGKCSGMLKHMLSETQVAQIMHAEMTCKANQIPAELVRVNGLPLDRDQLMLLLCCPNPPKGLKPGSYWYDRASGFWGKDGRRPCQIISPQLDVGGHLQRNASNGNTNVVINGRAITQEELFILKLARVPCEGRPNFWVNADGSYREEGMNKEKGFIWDKRLAKVACMFLSLPVPSKSAAPIDEGERVKRVSQDYRHQKTLHKFLLVGSVNSGTCTIFKQAKLLYDVPYSENELQNIKFVIQSNLFTYLGILLEARESFEEESLLENRKRWSVDESTSSGNTGNNIDTTIYSIGPKLKAFSDWLLKYMVSGNLDAIFPAAIREYGPLVEDLWSDEAIQVTYNRRNELKMLPRSASYFLDRAVEISRVDYEPSNMDILYAEGISLSNSLTSMEFSYPKSAYEDSLYPEYQHESSSRYQLIRVHPRSLGENCKWLEMFEGTDVVLFSVALADYDEYTVDHNGVATNKMLAAKHLFETIITHTTFNNKKFLLILTKFDLLEEKIELVPLTRCEWFCDFHPVISHNHNQHRGSNRNNSPPLAQRAFQYIAVKFKRLFHSLTGRKLFVSLVTGLEPDTVDEALRYAREVMVWEKWDPSFITEKSEITSTSIDEASSL